MINRLTLSLRGAGGKSRGLGQDVDASRITEFTDEPAWIEDMNGIFPPNDGIRFNAAQEPHRSFELSAITPSRARSANWS
jgi:hypothetical protein